MIKTSKYWAFKTQVCILMLAAGSVFARGQTPSPTPTPPASDIYVVEVKRQKDKLKFSQPIKITNTVGYNNQPSFMPDGKSILYTSIRDKQADIFGYDLGASKTLQITQTPES